MEKIKLFQEFNDLNESKKRKSSTSQNPFKDSKVGDKVVVEYREGSKKKYVDAKITDIIDLPSGNIVYEVDDSSIEGTVIFSFDADEGAISTRGTQIYKKGEVFKVDNVTLSK